MLTTHTLSAIGDSEGASERSHSGQSARTNRDRRGRPAVGVGGAGLPRDTVQRAVIADTLAEAGFEVITDLAASPRRLPPLLGDGAPVIGIMGEFDALPGRSQAAVPYAETVRVNPAATPAGTTSSARARSVPHWPSKTGSRHPGQSGTVRFYGTPAEEGGSGKVYLVRAGAFDRR